MRPGWYLLVPSPYRAARTGLDRRDRAVYFREYALRDDFREFRHAREPRVLREDHRALHCDPFKPASETLAPNVRRHDNFSMMSPLATPPGKPRPNPSGSDLPP
jgi:hypothetical protein